MRERLGDREAALRRRELVAEERDGDLVAGSRLVGEGHARLLESTAVVLDELARPFRRLANRLAVARVRHVRGELDDPLERAEVVGEGVGTAPG